MLTLPDYPWDTLAPYRKLAAEHPDGVVDLSIGTPVDPTPAVIQDALRAAADAPGYPGTHGTPALREAIAAWYVRRRRSPDLQAQDIMPTIGSKELVAWLPLFLGLGPGDIMVRPLVAYPTYDIGALLVGAESIAADSLRDLTDDQRSRVKLVWTNSPGNPTGKVLDAAGLREIVDDARSLGAVVAADECYAELGWGDWEEHVPCILEPAVSGGDLTNLLSVYSLSKQSNVAGYRASFVAGAPNLMPTLINSRKHTGMIMPYPVQEALRVAISDDAHVQVQKDLYRARREALKPALEAFGFSVHFSEAGLYLWCTAGKDSWESIQDLAELGIIAGPGVFYGDAGAGFVRVSLTASDERIASAVSRLTKRN
ncbi:succinyldiaminopimelate transaminase [Neomicrococcus aestuarii]|uniref:Succinyldiaminopimelate transaminase n=1 Tax=Neomicrococcus aestuarii TaxID=556325 RepID=A0A1L2ZQV5_9MICC|nr:succinyldiaminopimelate transaminase [Neomicrococcus aestuarii]APF41580.1 succinyldiaminopimelate transaminase [Neomicrococcus aestuarii]